MENEIKRDTGRFDARQWYIDGYHRFFFTSEQDAKDALGLAHAMAINERNAVCQKIRDALPD